MTRYLSVCSGIEAATVAWEPLGWSPSAFSDIDAFPSAVLAYHYPEVANLGDMTTLPRRITSGEVEAPEVLVGGTPCQAFSVSGLRGGLDDARGNLTLTYVEIANALDDRRIAAGLRPVVTVWENVPGVLTSKDNAFGCLLAGLAGEDVPLEPPGGKWTHAGCVLGPRRTVAWRVLDAQYFGVAQRRQRVFVIASAGTVGPPEVLFEWDGVRRDVEPSREAWQDASPDAACGAGECDSKKHLIPAAFNHQSGGSRMQPSCVFNLANTIQASQSQAIFMVAKHGEKRCADPLAFDVKHGLSPHASTALSPLAFPSDNSLGIRRIVPVEAERLMGFPDDYTAIPWRGKAAENCPDGHRQKALGNSMVVPVMRWIGERIARQLDHSASLML